MFCIICVETNFVDFEELCNSSVTFVQSKYEMD